MSFFEKIAERRIDESAMSRSYARISFKNKSLARIMCEGVEEIDAITTELSNAETENTLIIADEGTKNPESIDELADVENGVEYDENGNPISNVSGNPISNVSTEKLSESAMIIRESVSGFFSKVWEKIKAFFEKIKKWIVELYGKIVFMLKSIFASNKHLIDKYGSSVSRDYDGVEVQAVKINISELMKVKPENVDKIVNDIKAKLQSVLIVIGNYAQNMEDMSKDHLKTKNYTDKDKDELDYVIKDYNEDKYNKQKEIVDSDKFKEEIKNALNNDDNFSAIKVYEAMGGGSFDASSLSELSTEFKERYRESSSPVTISSKDVGGYSAIKDRMSKGADVIKKVENVRTKLEDAIKKIQRNMENTYTKDLKGVERTEAKSAISSAFTTSVDFLGDSIKAVNNFIKDWVELYKHQLGVDRSLFIKLYKKATGKKPQNNSVDGFEDESMSGVDTMDDEVFVDGFDENTENGGM